MTARLVAVCVVHADVPLGRRGVVDSAIDKRPVTGLVDVHELGIGGDHSSDTKFHGGIDQAVYAFDDAEARRWSDELGRELPPGWFGENLRTTGVPVTDAVIGSRWHIGTAVLEVTIARKPCGTFARWAEEPQWVKRFTARGDVGAYLKVIEPGRFGGGDAVIVDAVPAHGVTVRQLFAGRDAASLERLLAEPHLAAKVRRDAEYALRTARAS